MPHKNTPESAQSKTTRLLTGAVGTNVDGNDCGPRTFSLVSPPDIGSLTFSPDGTFSYLPARNFHGDVSFKYQICNAAGACDTATATIHVKSAGDNRSTANDSQASSGCETVIVHLLGNESDPVNEVLTVVEINGTAVSPGTTAELPSGAKVTLDTLGTAIYDANGQFEDLENGQTAIDTFTYLVADPNGGVTAAEAVITISGGNDVPIAEDDYLNTTVNTPVTFPVIRNDSDVAVEELTVILLNNPPHGAAVVNPSGTITFIPAPGFVGAVTLHYLVEGPGNASSDATDATVTIDVTQGFHFDSFTSFSQSRDLQRINFFESA